MVHYLKITRILFIVSMQLLVPTVAKSASLEPHQYVLALQRLQDQTVRGDTLAHKAQREMLEYMAESFSKVSVAVWQNKRNAEALLIYLLSGGNPTIVEKLLSIKNQPNLPEGALAGALAYVLGDHNQAKKLLNSIEFKGMSINARAQIAIVHATLYAENDHKKALKFLSNVRLWKPGTLLEEASLRRAFSIAGEQGETENFLRWSSQYVRRFNNSVYLPDFISKFSFFVTKQNLAGNPDLVNTVVQIIDRLKKGQQASVYLTVARSAVLDGNRQQARFMAKRARALLKKGTKPEARAMLYFTAAQFGTEVTEKIKEFLSKTDRNLLNKEDQKLYDTVELMIAEVQKKPRLSKAMVASLSNKSPQQKFSEKQMMPVPIMVNKAKNLIKNANKLLEKGK